MNEKLKTKHLKIHVVVIPTARDRLIPELAEGLGDIAAGFLNISDQRLKSVDFSDPLLKGVSEIRLQDPNVWFRNVEVVAAKRIGRETVQYVGNIYKYYLAYRLIVDEKEFKAKNNKQ